MYKRKHSIACNNIRRFLASFQEYEVYIIHMQGATDPLTLGFVIRVIVKSTKSNIPVFTKE